MRQKFINRKNCKTFSSILREIVHVPLPLVADVLPCDGTGTCMILREILQVPSTLVCSFVMVQKNKFMHVYK